MTWNMAGPFVFFISFVPGFVEEVFFRGYMQRRLLHNWPVWASIVVASLLFAFLHLDLHQICFAFPIGIWLGVIAWRTGSIWPSMLCHAAINATSMTYNIGVKLLGWPDPPPLIPSMIGGVLVLVCFFASAWLLARQRPEPTLEMADDMAIGDVPPQSDDHVAPDHRGDVQRQTPDERLSE
jgi:membrane protease YdiL (CAAX protease family)